MHKRVGAATYGGQSIHALDNDSIIVTTCWGTDKYLLLSQGRVRLQGRISPPSPPPPSSHVKATGLCYLLLWYAEAIAPLSPRSLQKR